MAEQSRVHPTTTTEGTVMAPCGDVKFVEIDYLSSVAAETGPSGSSTGTIAHVTEMLGTFGTVVWAGPLFDSNTKQLFGLEGMTQDTAVAEFGTLTVIQAALQALATPAGVALGSATAIYGGPSESKQDAIV
jgi:hypothetical protein